MGDYEVINAREWDPYYKEPPKSQPPQDDWQVVDHKRRQHFKHRPSPQQPNAQAQPQKQQARPEQANPRPQTQRLHQKAQQQAKPQHNTSPRKWQTTGPLKKLDQTKRPPPELLLDCDNDAEAAWRARAKPVDDVRIPEDLVLQDRTHERLAKQYGTFIFSPHPKGSGGSKTFGLWGETKAVALTKRAIANWIEEMGMGTQKAKLSSRFAKVVSLTPELRKRAEKRWEREVIKQKFRQHPKPDMAFHAVGSFHWPVQEYKPEEVLGGSYEALDPVRMEQSCYVVYNKKRDLFRVMGKVADVQAGLLRLRKTCFQIAARSLSPVRIYLLRWTKSEVPLYVYLQDYHHPAILSPEDAPVEKPSRSPRGEADAIDEDRSRQAETQTALNNERLRSSILRTLRKLHYYRGSIQMRVRLGTFLFGRFRGPNGGVYDLEEYESMTQELQFIGQVTSEVGHKPTEEALLLALQAAKDLITPSDATIADLSDVKPVYSAIFTFADEAGDLRLTVEWHEAHDAFNNSANLEEISKKWTRLERDNGTPTSLLDVSLTDLNSSTAWQFDILASQAVDEAKLPQQLITFARNLRIDPALAKKQSADRIFVRYNPFATLRSIQQRISYRYTIANSDFKLELARLQDRNYPSRSTSSPSGMPTVYEPRWSLSVYRTEWDTMFTQNERLPIGESTTWKDDVVTWFPYDVGPGASSVGEDEGQGWEQMVDKLGRIEALVAVARADAEEMGVEEDLLGGMAHD